MCVDKQKKLFDDMFAYVGCNYLSDLVSTHNSSKIKQFIYQHPAHEFLQREWADLHFYLLRANPECDSAEAIRTELLQKL